MSPQVELIQGNDGFRVSAIGACNDGDVDDDVEFRFQWLRIAGAMVRGVYFFGEIGAPDMQLTDGRQCECVVAS